MQAAQKHQPDIMKLASQLGPIPPKYIPRPEDNEKPGAMDIDDIDQEDLDPTQIEMMKDYNKRYGDKRTASAVLEASFQYVYNSLLDMGKKNGMIQLNRAGNTVATLGAFAVYRGMVLDMIMFGKVADNGCHGFQLKINNDVSMLPSQPEKIIQYKDNQKGGLDPILTIHYKQRDDFTPDEEALGLRDGVNAPAVKWILDQLTTKEKEHLFTLLMAPVIKNHHPDYKAMRAFMSNRQDPRVKLVETASVLIEDIAGGIKKKFEKNALIKCWGANANDWDIEPFIKAEDDIQGLDKIGDDGLVQVAKGPIVVDWKVDLDVLGDKRPYDVGPRQKDFICLIVAAQQSYQILYQDFEESLLKEPSSAKKGEQFQFLDWAPINKQYHVAHQMIGADFEGRGGERCLFSNLLAVLIKDKDKLTSSNVRKLRNAMANYLDTLQRAKNSWNIEKLKPAHAQSKDAAINKEMADLAAAFEDAIRKTHGCQLNHYQSWLRGDAWGAANIDASNLTPLEIQLASYTMGVRIGLFPIKVKGATKVDDNGRIIPDGEYYGPNTKEFLLMGCYDPMDGKGGTYYGLFPKLNVVDNDKLEDNPSAYAAALDLESYWTSIDINNHIKE